MEGGVPAILWYFLAVGFVLFAIILPIWFGILTAHRNRIRALKILKTYAERGEDPPPEVLKAVLDPEAKCNPDSEASSGKSSSYLERFILNTCVAIAAAGIAWWRIADGGGPEWLVIAAVIAAAIFGACAIASLIAMVALRGNHDR